MLMLILSRLRSGARSIQPPDGQYTPTFCDVNELTTSGTFPERRAAVILSSLIEPTTFTVTSGFLASYSATTFLNSLSSRALQPTQMVRFVAVARSLAAGEPAAPIAAVSTRPA